jgi:general secretion pathway protein I
MKMSGSGQRCAGFTLMEVLVALLILGLAFGVLLPSFSFGLNSVDRTRFHVLALSEARSQIDRIGSEVPLVEGEFSGTSNLGLGWAIHLRRHASGPTTSETGEETTVIPFEVEVTVHDAAGQRLTIRTLRLATPG